MYVAFRNAAPPVTSQKSKKNPEFPEWSFSYRFRTKLDMRGESAVDFRFLLKPKERCILKDFGVKKQKIYTTLST